MKYLKNRTYQIVAVAGFVSSALLFWFLSSDNSSTDTSSASTAKDISSESSTLEQDKNTFDKKEKEDKIED